MSEHDRIARAALEGLTTAIPDEDDVLHAIRRGTAIVHRRRRVARVAGAVAAVTLGGLILAWRPSRPDGPYTDDRSVPTITGVLDTSTVSPTTLPVPSTGAVGIAPSEVVVASVPTSVDLTAAPITTGAPPPRPVPTTEAPRPPRTTPRTAPPPPPTEQATTVPTTLSPPTTPGPTTTTMPPTTTQPATTTSIAASIRKTRVTQGGSITVESVGSDQLRVIEVVPAEGYSSTIVQASGTSIAVTLVSTDWRYQITALFDGKRIPFTVVKEYIGPPTSGE